MQKTPHVCLFWWTRIWITWLWKDLDAKPLTPGQLLGWPWKLWGITLQTSYVKGRWHQNWAHTSPLQFFTVGARKFAKNWLFWVKCAIPKNFQLNCFLENVIGLGDQTPVSNLQRLKVRSQAKNGYRYGKSEPLQKKTLRQFWSHCFETIRTLSPNISEPMFY